MQSQQRRLGAPLAKKVYAKQKGRFVTLHVVASKTYMAQDREFRKQITEGFYRFWRLRCQSNGACVESDAQVVVLDSNDVEIGGSRAGTEEVWVN